MKDTELNNNDNELRKRLTPEEYHVLRGRGTEKPFSGILLHNKEKGMYRCKACGAELFSSNTKFDSGTGWPSFFAPLEGSVGTTTDRSLGMKRLEVHCRRCGGHLGHVFDDGPPPTGLRFCINSVALRQLLAATDPAKP